MCDLGEWGVEATKDHIDVKEWDGELNGGNDDFMTRIRYSSCECILNAMAVLAWCTPYWQ